MARSEGHLVKDLRRGRRRLAAIVAAVAILWLAVLPALTKSETVRRRIAWLERNGIEPAAFNYSDHPAAREVVAADLTGSLSPSRRCAER